MEIEFLASQLTISKKLNGSKSRNIENYLKRNTFNIILTILLFSLDRKEAFLLRNFISRIVKNSIINMSSIERESRSMVAP